MTAEIKQLVRENPHVVAELFVDLQRREQEVAAQLSLLQTDRARLDADRKELTARQLQHAERVAEFAAEREREQQHSEYNRAIAVKPPTAAGPVIFGASDMNK